MRKDIFVALFVGCMMSTNVAAEETPVWKNPEVNQQNRAARRSNFFAFENEKLAAQGEKKNSKRYLSMEGKW